jgi:hypothetical protein
MVNELFIARLLQSPHGVRHAGWTQLARGDHRACSMDCWVCKVIQLFVRRRKVEAQSRSFAPARRGPPHDDTIGEAGTSAYQPDSRTQ